MATKNVMNYPSPLQTVLARALYDNVAELPKELEFRRNDIITVINQKIDNLPGWWLCNYRGKVGLAPANRLQLLGITRNDKKDSESEHNSAADTTTSIYSDPSSIYKIAPFTQFSTTDNLHRGARTPNSLQCDDGSYSIPPPTIKALQSDATQDISKAVQLNEDHGYCSNRSSSVSTSQHILCGSSSKGESHDSLFVENNNTDMETHDYYEALNSTKAKANDSSSLVNTNNGKLPEQPTYYNVNNESHFRTSLNMSTTPQKMGFHFASTGDDTRGSVYDDVSDEVGPDGIMYDSIYDNEDDIKLQNINRLSTEIGSIGTPVKRCSRITSSTSSLSSCSSFTKDELSTFKFDLVNKETNFPLISSNKMTSAVDFTNLYRNVENTSNSVFKFITNRWNTKEYLLVNSKVIRFACEIAQKANSAFVCMCEQILGLAIEQCSDKAMPKKLWKHIKPLKANIQKFDEAMQSLKDLDWNPVKISDLVNNTSTDYLTILISTLRNCNIEARSLSVIVRANESIIFSSCKSTTVRPLPDLPETTSSNFQSDAQNHQVFTSFLNLESSLEKIKLGISSPHDTGKQRRSESFSDRTKFSEHLQSPAMQSLCWYGAQLISSIDIFDAAVCNFTKALQTDQPPNVFVQHSKFVVVSGQKLVYLGDAIGRALYQRPNLAVKITHATNELCDMLKHLVITTKAAISSYPDSNFKSTILQEISRLSKHVHILCDLVSRVVSLN